MRDSWQLRLRKLSIEFQYINACSILIYKNLACAMARNIVWNTVHPKCYHIMFTLPLPW